MRGYGDMTMSELLALIKRCETRAGNTRAMGDRTGANLDDAIAEGARTEIGRRDLAARNQAETP